MATGIRISLPKATIQNNQLIKAVVITYKTLKEMIPSSSANSSNINPAGSTIQINSQIISISFYPDRYGNLSHPVRIIFENTNTIENKNTAKENVCAFWASAPSQCGWDSTGCRTGSESNSTHTVCYCSHTTTFSVITRDKLVQSLQIEVITYICCGIAIAVLALTIAIFVMHWKDVKSIVNVMNINIFLCLLMINILVISGLTAIYWKPLCVAISIFLHYIFLAAYSWLLRCAICMHYLFAKNKLAPGSIMGNFLTCCILPATIPILVGIIQVSRYGFDGYLSHYACWLSTTPPVVVTFIIPMILLALAALIYNVLTTTRASSNARVVYDYNDEELEINRKNFRQSFVVLVTFIMTSILFVAFTSTKDIVCQYIFAIISLIQSIYILLFYALKNKEIQMDCKSKAKNHTAYELKPTKGKSSSHLTPANYNNYEDVGEDAIYQEVD
ncbi:uncharacterized protein TRIADDRAFT_60092 [Trichoplax adhaerens]|uniref:GPS domain-containing protein n=1 Tax=Trichoplax adhaerens TaxID=10228 RepID=B3S7A1_TRIAD|nr:hypothetical protein TRIADDRAFT_60092 [Trichoplax adhaerens]EDV21451.1 hypothetical protein TRIADDRAFT_60092 [Trichoplax adhaerens]|eukprot:XP_002116051.1 hypothetical protein TRIADDRAFT_60092 [Trichoplax adhaerens]